MKLYEIISEQDFAGYTKEKTGSILSSARLDLEKTKKYFMSLFDKVSVMSLSNIDNSIVNEIENARKNADAIGHKSDSYFDVLETLGDNPISEIDDIATELDDYRMLVSDLIEIMDNLSFAYNHRLGDYLKQSKENGDF